ncbi:unnamed protein product [Linum tenue]|uniref:Uncharacterized protein n=2 Tax=Linum tenue TaxID=586396 RepID=A0AAV0P7I5_9ROSI|nr:unnamed protein product [Linum tenue]
MEDFRAANDRMYNNAGEWNYDEPTNNVGLAVFSHDVAKLEPPPGRANKLIVASTGSPLPIVVSSAAARNYRQAYKKARARSEAEAKRQKRVVKYRSYATESRMRASVNSGLRWLKNLVR